MGAGLAATLLNVLTLVKAGMELKTIVDKAKVMEANGASDKDISDWIRRERDFAMAELDKALA